MSDLLSHPQCFGNNKTDRSDAFNSSGSSSSSSIAEVFTKTTNITSKPGLFLPDRDSIKQCVKKETYSVGGKFMIKKLKITEAKRTKFGDTNRCIKIRVGSFCNGVSTEGNGQRWKRV